MRLVFFLFCYLSGFTIFYTKGQKLSGLFKIITWVSKKEQSYYIHNVIVTAEFFILQRENTSRDKKPSTAIQQLGGLRGRKGGGRGCTTTFQRSDDTSPRTLLDDPSPLLLLLYS